jgi:hypothetical protein
MIYYNYSKGQEVIKMKYKIVEIFKDGRWIDRTIYKTKEEAIKVMLEYMIEDEEVGESNIYKIIEEKDLKKSENERN